MTQQEFEQHCAAGSKMTVEQMHALGMRPIPCDCGEEGCRGWQMVHASVAELDPRSVPGKEQA